MTVGKPAHHRIDYALRTSADTGPEHVFLILLLISVHYA
jgi:hypothetical protein